MLKNIICFKYDNYILKREQIIIMILFMVMISCFKNSYEKTIHNYFKYIKNNDLENAYNLLSLNDKNSVSLEEYISDSENNYIEIEISKRIKYKIIESNLSATGQSVDVKVEIKKIYLPYLYNKIPELANPSISEKEVKKIFKKYYKVINESYTENSISYLLIYEKDKWVINADYGRKRHLNIILKKAEQLYNSKKLEESLKIYKKALDFDRYNMDAVKNIEKIEERLRYIEEYIEFDYLNKIDENGILNIEFIVKNIGTYMLKEIYVESIVKNNSKIITKPIGEILKDKPLAFNESRKKIIKFDYDDNYDNVTFRIYGIDF